VDDVEVVLCPTQISGARNGVGGDVIEKIEATKMYFEEVAPMIVVVGGRSRVMGIKGITLKIVSV
jgi:hypothetical protein